MRPEAPKRDAAAPSPLVIEEAQSLGRQILEARRKQGMSQDDLAFSANVSPRTVFAIEQGKPTVRLDMLTRVLGAVGLRLTTESRDRLWIPLD